MRARIAKFARDGFVRNNILLFGASMMTAFLNYLIYPILGRLMDLKSFGETQALFSLLTAFTALATVFRFSAVNLVSNTEEAPRREMLQMMHRLIFGVVLAVSTLVVLMSGPLAGWLHFDSRWPFVGLAAMLAVSFFLNFRLAISHGLNDFAAVSAGGLMVSGTKLALSVILVIVGFKTMGPVLGLIAGSTLALAYLTFKTRGTLKFAAFRHGRLDRRILGELRYLGLVLAANLGIVLLYALDVVVVKRYFPADEAGLYGGIATVGRIVLFATGSISAVVLSSVKIGASVGQNAALLCKALLLLGLVGAPTLAVFCLAPGFVVKVLIGSAYLPYVWLLPKVALMSFLASVAGLVIFYHLALRRSFLFWVTGAVAAAVVVLTAANHGSVSDVVNDFLLAGGLALALLAWKTWPEISSYLKVFAYAPENLDRRPIV